MQTDRRSLKVLNILIVLSLLGGLLLGACDGGQFSIDLNLGEGGEGEGSPANSTFFVLMIALFVVVLALVFVAGR